MPKFKPLKYNIGDIFKNEKRNIIILEKLIYRDENNKLHKKYKYKCNLCGWDEGLIYESNLDKGDGCSCCKQAKKNPVAGFTDIYTTHPWMIEFLKNKDDGYKYTYSSNKKVDYLCPNCGSEDYKALNNIFVNHGRCKICNDGFSYPNRVAYNLLKSIEVNFENEKRFDWSNNKRYDIYIKENDLIIEMHGGFHYDNSDGFKNLEYNKENDLLKYNLAIENGIKPENYIVIDCRKSDINYIKNNVLLSHLSNIYDLSNVNWENIDLNSTKSILVEVCFHWNNKLNEENVKSVSDKFKIEKSTLRKYLNKGTELGLCNYNGKEEAHRSKRNMANIINTKRVQILKDGNFIFEYNSVTELSDSSENYFGVKLTKTGIARCARGERKQYKGFTFKYIEDVS